MKTQHNELNKEGVTLPSVGWEDIKSWLVSFALPVAMLVLGSTIFAPVIQTSIQNASHPGLVYGIFVAFVLGLLLAAFALVRFQKERRYVKHWTQLPDNKQRRSWIESNPWHAKFTVYPALSAVVLRMPASERQAKFEHEVRAVESGLADRLLFPNFIAGSLVGLGLVGTFVGLLGTLEDLGAVFGSLAKTGDSGANPTAVFADMVQKLQDPMRGMGTAFVTSLYGLLGSLVLGLTSLSISKLANIIVKDLYSAERMYASTYSEDLPTVRTRASATEPQEGGPIEASLNKFLAAQLQKDAQIERWLEQSESRLVKMIEDSAQTHQKSAQNMLAALQQLTERSQTFSEQTQVQQQNLGETVRLLANQINGDRTMIYRELLTLIENNRGQVKQDISNLEAAVSGALQVTEKSARNIERFVQVQQEAVDALPKTAYWREAWVKVQQFLSHSHQQQDVAALAHAIEKQTVVLHHLADHLAHQDWLQSQGGLGRPNTKEQVKIS